MECNDNRLGIKLIPVGPPSLHYSSAEGANNVSLHASIVAELF